MSWWTTCWPVGKPVSGASSLRLGALKRVYTARDTVLAVGFDSHWLHADLRNTNITVRDI